MSPLPFRVKAIFDYSSPHEDDLQFSLGQVITITDIEDDEWYMGEYVDDAGVKQEGIFPRNFVEKFEPTAPPRPTRPAKKEPEHAVKEQEATSPTSSLPVGAEVAPSSPPKPPSNATEEEHRSPKANPPRDTSTTASAAPTQPPVRAAESIAPPPAQKASPVAQSKPSNPPPVSEKPASTSFKDRIAAFNKAGATPITPFKPATASTFIKKPFVPPPPSRDAYVPVPRQEQVPQKLYRREEDPEVKELEEEIQETAEKAGFTSTANDADAEDQPKPTSLKERIALLQKQQAEAAQRHADAAAKKEKPKKPVKKRLDTTEATEGAPESHPAPALDRRQSEDINNRTSTDEPRSPRMPTAHRRKSSRSVVPESFNDGNDADMSGAGDTTEGQEEPTERDEAEDRPKPPPAPQRAAAPAAHQPVEEEEPIEEEEEGEEEEEEEDQSDFDPELRRKEELRARMAKMSGGMGMHGMFGPPGMPMPSAIPPKKKKAASHREDALAEEEDETSPVSRAAPPIPTMMALPGMSQRPPPRHEEPADEAEPATSAPPPPRQRPAVEADVHDSEAHDRPAGGAAPPPIPTGRPGPPPVPSDSRPPPPPAEPVVSPSAGSDSDDELSEQVPESAPRPPPLSDVSRSSMPPPSLRSPPPLPPSLPSPTTAVARPPPPVPPMSPRSEEVPTPTSPSFAPSKRNSRLPPPIPGSAPLPPPSQSRPPPPPPPVAAPTRQSTADSQESRSRSDEEITEYEGDYDTDIASSAPHKDALKSHARDSSLEDNAPLQSPVSDAPAPPSLPPPIPGAHAPRDIPPPVPSQAPPPPASRRLSVDAPRAAPPPPPPPVVPLKESAEEADEEYDPYNFTVHKPGSYNAGATPKAEETSYFGEPSSSHSPPLDRRGAPAHPPLPSRAPPKQSFDISRAAARRSTDLTRASMETGFIANDIDLAMQSGWWKQQNQVPPVLQGRKDVHFESEESTTTNGGAKTVVTRTTYVLFQDYSQTIITVHYDPYDPSDVELEQMHEPPPRPPRQDQLENSYERFGRVIAETVSSKKDTVVADGTPQGLVHDLLRPFRDALLPVGTRAYGALVYANLANASTQQTDQIRPGDIVTLRNARFQGKHGPMHAKYSAEVGKPDHVAVVAEWDGTKKKVRAWEQGRENKKVKLESFKLDDLRSGEVKVWRVMPRSWVGWNTQP